MKFVAKWSFMFYEFYSGRNSEVHFLKVGGLRHVVSSKAVTN